MTDKLSNEIRAEAHTTTNVETTYYIGDIAVGSTDDEYVGEALVETADSIPQDVVEDGLDDRELEIEHLEKYKPRKLRDGAIGVVLTGSFVSAFEVAAETPTERIVGGLLIAALLGGAVGAMMAQAHRERKNYPARIEELKAEMEVIRNFSKSSATADLE